MNGWRQAICIIALFLLLLLLLLLRFGALFEAFYYHATTVLIF